MKRAILLPLVGIAGLGAGAGSGVAVGMLRPSGAKAAAEEARPVKDELGFVPTGPILAPMVTPDGALAGYASFECQLQVPEAKAEEVGQHLPLLLHEVNMRTYRLPLAAGPNGELPDLELFRRILLQSSEIAFGKGVVRRVAITNAHAA